MKYGPRGYRYVLEEAGHLSQNLMLVAAATELGSLPIGGFRDQLLNELLTVDGVNEAAVYGTILGHTPDTLRDADGDGELSALRAVLTGQRTVESLLADLDDQSAREVGQILKQLEDERLIVPTADETTPSAGYLSLTDGMGRFESIEESEVALLAAGPMGRMVAADLDNYGVGEMHVIDVDGTEEYPEGVRRREVDALETVLGDVDFGVYLSDAPYPELAERFDRAAHETGTDWTAGQIHGFDGLVGPTIVPTKTPCYNCFKERAYANVTRVSGFRKYEAGGATSAIGSMSNFARIVAGLVSTEVVTHLNRGVGFTVGRVIHYDLFDLSVEPNDVLKLPRCDRCGAESLIDDHQENMTFSDLVEETRVIR